MNWYIFFVNIIFIPFIVINYFIKYFYKIIVIYNKFVNQLFHTFFIKLLNYFYFTVPLDKCSNECKTNIVNTQYLTITKQIKKSLSTDKSSTCGRFFL
jgi:hypothetical protein